MKIPFIDLDSINLSIKNEIDNVFNEIINKSQFIYGPYVEEFEKNFASKLGVKHCIGVGNGTDALIITLKLLGIKQGDEVITAANTFIATSESITAVGATPVFVDVDEYFTIDVDKIEEKITKKTKAVIAVHLYGQPAQIDVIKEICEKYHIFLIEDAAQAHFSKFNEKYCGTFGHAACFSFYPAKNLGALGDGGCIVTNDDDLAQKIRIFTNHGSPVKHIHIIEGINSRLDALQAAVLNIKLKYIEKWNQQRLDAALLYNRLLSDIPYIEVPKIRKDAQHTFHLYVIKTQKRDELQKYLSEKGIGTGIHYKYALPFMECYRFMNHKPQDFPVAYSNQERILSLPMYPQISESQINLITETIKSYYKR